MLSDFQVVAGHDSPQAVGHQSLASVSQASRPFLYEEQDDCERGDGVDPPGAEGELRGEAQHDDEGEPERRVAKSERSDDAARGRLSGIQKLDKCCRERRGAAAAAADRRQGGQDYPADLSREAARRRPTARLRAPEDRWCRGLMRARR